MLGSAEGWPATGVSIGGLNPTFTAGPDWAGCRTSATAVGVVEILLTLKAAEVSVRPVAMDPTATSEGVSEPPHAASEIQSESTLNDMKQGRSGVGVIIGGQ